MKVYFPFWKQLFMSYFLKCFENALQDIVAICFTLIHKTYTKALSVFVFLLHLLNEIDVYLFKIQITVLYYFWEAVTLFLIYLKKIKLLKCYLTFWLDQSSKYFY